MAIRQEGTIVLDRDKITERVMSQEEKETLDELKTEMNETLQQIGYLELSKLRLVIVANEISEKMEKLKSGR